MLYGIANVCDVLVRQRGVFPVGQMMTSTGGGGSSSYRPGGGGTDVTVNASGLPPWVEPPPNFQPFDFPGIIATPAAGVNDAVVLSFTTPNGWDGVIKKITNRYTGPGFSEGSGDLIWRIRIDGQYAKNYDSITTTMGDIENGREVPGGLIVRSSQVVEYLISVAPAFAPGPGTNVVCFFTGYFWPRN